MVGGKHDAIVLRQVLLVWQALDVQLHSCVMWSAFLRAAANSC